MDPSVRWDDDVKHYEVPSFVILFFALLFFATAIAGFCAFVIFWPLTLVHVRDRHPGIANGFGAGAFLKPEALGWLLSGRYRQTQDRSLTGLATPAKVSLLVILAGLAGSGLLWLLSVVLA